MAQPSGIDLLFKGAAEPVQTDGGTSGADLLFGSDTTGVRPAAPRIKSADLTYDPNRTLGFFDQAKGSFAATDDQWKRIAAQSLYPNEDPAAAAKRFHKTTDGRVYHISDDGVAYEVQPPKGWARLANVGEGVGAALPAIAGGVAGIAALPLGGIGSVAGAATGAYAGDVARQTIGNMIAGGPSEYNQASALTEGAVGAVGQGVGNAIGRFATRLNPVDIGHYNQQATADLLHRAEQMGIRLTPAEATNLASLIGEQKRLSGSPNAQNVMGRFFDERNREVSGAWQAFLDSIAPGRDATTLGRQAAGIAEDVLTRAQAARTAAVQPFYEAAERQIGSVNPGGIVQFIEDAMPTAKGSERAALRYAMSQLQRVGPDGATDGTVDMSFRGLNGAKMAIDSLLADPEMAAKQGIDRHAHATLDRIRNMIVNAIEANPGARGPGGTPGPYAAGRATYGTLTDQTVTPVQEILAPLLRLNPSNSGSLVRVAESVLNPATRTPDLVAQARRMIEPRAPDVWSGMVRQFLQDHAVTALQENAKGSVSNVGGNIAKRIGTDPIEANLRAAMSPARFRQYQDILDVFRATGRALDANSDTAFKQEAIKNAKDAAGGWVARIIRNINPAKLIENSANWFADASYERQAAAIARIYAQGDQDAIRALRSLRQLSPDDVRRHIIIGHALAKSGEFGASKAME